MKQNIYKSENLVVPSLNTLRWLHTAAVCPTCEEGVGDPGQDEIWKSLNRICFNKVLSKI